MQEIKDSFRTLFTDTLSIIGIVEVTRLTVHEKEIGPYQGISKTFKGNGYSIVVGVTGGHCTAIIMDKAKSIMIENEDSSIPSILDNMKELQTKLLGEL